MNMKYFGIAAIALMLIAGPVMALQQYAGNFVLEVYNGTSTEKQFTWIKNDESEPITISVTLNCRGGETECDYLKYVKVSPERFEVPAGADGNITVTAEIPADYDVGQNFTGYMFGRKESVQSGQVTIQLQVGKIIEVHTLLKKSEERIVAVEQAPAATPGATFLETLIGPSSPVLAGVILLLLIVLIVVIAGRKGSQKSKSIKGKQR